MTPYHAYIFFIIAVKLLFVIFAVTHLYYKVKGEVDSDSDKKAVFWKERLEFVFITLMSVLLIYTFNPRSNRELKLDYETKLLMYLFGFILIVTAKWDIFIHESPLLKKFQSVV